jgi:hypothetical protein
MVDTLYPEVGIAIVKILEHLEIEVDFLVSKPAVANLVTTGDIGKKPEK